MLDEPPSQLPILILAGLAVFEFLLASFFSACRASLHTADRQELPLFDDPGLSRSERILFRHLRRPARLAIGLSVGENGGYAFALALSVAAGAISLAPLDSLDILPIAATLFLALLVIFLVGKVLFMHYLGTPDFILVWSPLLSFFLLLMFPLVWLIEKFLFILEKPEEYLSRVGATELDFWSVMPEAESELDDEEREMIRSIYEFGETTAREIMTPRTDLQAIDVETPGPEVLEFLAASRYTRFPVYEESLDSIIGVIHVKNVIKALAAVSINDLDLRSIATEPFYVPETKKLDELLQEIKDARKQMVIVLDEYSGVSGIVTLEDILEEIVGEIQDEYDDEAKQIIPLKNGLYNLSARLPIEEMNEELGTTIDDEDFDTVGGLVLSQLGRIPEKGDRFAFEGWDFTVLSMDGNRINLVRAETSANNSANLERIEANGSRAHPNNNNGSKKRESGVEKR